MVAATVGSKMPASFFPKGNCSSSKSSSEEGGKGRPAYATQTTFRLSTAPRTLCQNNLLRLRKWQGTWPENQEPALVPGKSRLYLGGVLDLFCGAISVLEAVGHGGRCCDDRGAVLLIQALMEDLHVQ